MSKIILHGDLAVGHTDIQGNPINGIISSNSSILIGGVYVAKTGDIVHFPSHAHALDVYGNPTDYRTHDVAVVGNSKSQDGGVNLVSEGDVVAVADEAGGNATMVSSQSKFYSS